MTHLDEISRLLTLAEEFRQAVHTRLDDSSIQRAIGPLERESIVTATEAIEKLDQEIEKAGRGDHSGGTEKLKEEMGKNALRIIDAFAGAASRLLGADDAFIFLPQDARNKDTATSFASYGAPNLAILCRRSL